MGRTLLLRTCVLVRIGQNRENCNSRYSTDEGGMHMPCSRAALLFERKPGEQFAMSRRKIDFVLRGPSLLGLTLSEEYTTSSAAWNPQKRDPCRQDAETSLTTARVSMRCGCLWCSRWLPVLAGVPWRRPCGDQDRGQTAPPRARRADCAGRGRRARPQPVLGGLWEGECLSSPPARGGSCLNRMVGAGGVGRGKTRVVAGGARRGVPRAAVAGRGSHLHPDEQTCGILLVVIPPRPGARAGPA